MKRSHWVILQKTDGYLVGRAARGESLHEVACPPGEPSDAIAGAVYRVMEEHGYSGQPTLLAIGSLSCLAATFSHAGRAMSRNHQTMAYALEEHLPIAAEDFVCDFLTAGDEALGIAAETRELQQLVRGLENAGVAVGSVSPSALLAMQAEKGNRRPLPTAVVWRHGERVELFHLSDGTPRVWRCIGTAPEDIAREITVLEMETGRKLETLVARGFTEEQPESLRQRMNGVSVVVEERTIESAVVDVVSQILSGGEPAWIELRRNEIGDYDPHRPIRGSLRLLAVATACLLLTLAAALWIRGDKYGARAASAQTEQQAVFRRLFPGQAAPVGVHARLESEYRKLAGATGQSESSSELCPVLPFLCTTLSAMPEEMRFRLHEIRFERERVYLEGEVRHHSDADVLATALRSAGFDIRAPRTEQLAEEGVGFSLSAIAATETDEDASDTGGPLQ